MADTESEIGFAQLGLGNVLKQDQLVIWAPPMLPAFIGGWMALKFAADWQRRPDDLKAIRGSLIFLIGSTLSFAVAIGAGLIVSRAAVDIWATPN